MKIALQQRTPLQRAVAVLGLLFGLCLGALALMILLITVLAVFNQ